jgi:hypothetical protein
MKSSPRLTAFAATLLAGACLGVLAMPASALAGQPLVRETEVLPTGASSAEVVGEVNPAGESTEYHVAYGLFTTQWCQTDGMEGSPQHVTAPQTVAFIDGAYHDVSVTVGGLVGGKQYCLLISATNASGTTEEELSSLLAGLPIVSRDEVAPTGVAGATFEAEIDPAGQQTKYVVLYGLESSEWCVTEGEEGLPLKSPEQTLPAQDAVAHVVSVPLSGLVAGDSYCAELLAHNATGQEGTGFEEFEVGVSSGYTSEVSVTGATTAEVHGAINPDFEAASYGAQYALGTSSWCTTNAKSGTPEATSSQPLAFQDAGYHRVSVALSGLIPGTQYCATLAVGGPGARPSSLVRYFTAGQPLGSIDRSTATGPSTEAVTAQIQPTGQASSYALQYALRSSEWCTSSGAHGAHSSTTSVSLPFEDESYHGVSIAVGGLVTGSEYCVKLQVAAATTLYSPQAFFTAGALDLTARASLLGAATETITAELDPSGQQVSYEVGYALSGSAWCVSGGAEGSATHIGPRELPFEDAEEHQVSFELTGLTGGSEYCAVVLASAGTNHARSTALFVPGEPAVEYAEAIPAGATAEMIAAEVNPAGQSSSYTVAYALTGTKWCETAGAEGLPAFTSAAQALAAHDDAFHPVSLELSGLSPGNTYCTIIVAKNATATASTRETFLVGAPAITELEPLPDSATAETVDGEIDPNGQATEYHVAYGPSNSRWCYEGGETGRPEHSTALKTLAGTDTSSHPVAVELSGLSTGRYYCAEIIATNASQVTVKGGRVYFTAGRAAVSTDEAASVTATSAEILGTLDPAGQSTEYHVAYASSDSEYCETDGEEGSPEGTTAVTTLGFADAQNHPVSAALSGLTASTGYCAQLIAHNASGTTFSGEVGFETPAAASKEEEEAKEAKEATTTGSGTKSGPATTTTTTTTSTPTTPQPSPAGPISLIGTGVFAVAAAHHQITLEILCRGTSACSGKLTLLARVATGKGKHKHTRSVVVGTASFSIAAGGRSSIKLTLNAAGRSLLSAGHGHAKAMLQIVKSLPGPSTTQTTPVQIVLQKAVKHGK